jgi:hypothetical protein
LTSTGSGHSAPGHLGGRSVEDAARVDNAARRQELDAVVQLVFAAGVSLHETADLSDQTEVVQRLEEISSGLDAIIRHVWQANLPSVVPLGPSGATDAVPA